MLEQLLQSTIYVEPITRKASPVEEEEELILETSNQEEALEDKEKKEKNKKKKKTNQQNTNWLKELEMQLVQAQKIGGRESFQPKLCQSLMTLISKLQ